MPILFENPKLRDPEVSFVLLDWSCRESFHMLHYLNRQSVPRDRYEIIWIEYYGRRAGAIETPLREAERAGRFPVLDQWIVLDMPEEVYYHKHLMYNVGILAARGKIVTLCDSDVMVQPTFVESIVQAFGSEPALGAADSGIVLHHDEVRNIDPRYYPFNYPSFDELLGEQCINWEDGQTRGLRDRDDPLHTRNYGACMSALREDLIAIGGADEHIDYLGHICGPYELTFRLVNAGKKEIWHPREFLFHTWHPGTDGHNNYLGPHDGRNMSSTALRARFTGRTRPLRENAAIERLRRKTAELDRDSLLREAVPEEKRNEWSLRNLARQKASTPESKTVYKMVLRQFGEQALRFLKKNKTPKQFLRGVFISSFRFFRERLRVHRGVHQRCERCLQELSRDGIQSFALFGVGDEAETLYQLARDRAFQIQEVFDFSEGSRFHQLTVKPVEGLRSYPGQVVLGTQDQVDHRLKTLKELGVDAERIVVLW